MYMRKLDEWDSRVAGYVCMYIRCIETSKIFITLCPEVRNPQSQSSLEGACLITSRPAAATAFLHNSTNATRVLIFSLVPARNLYSYTISYYIYTTPYDKQQQVRVRSSGTPCLSFERKSILIGTYFPSSLVLQVLFSFSLSTISILISVLLSFYTR